MIHWLPSREEWIGAKPDLLQTVSDELWRSEADTRERLELLALKWVESYVLGDGDLEELVDYPQTRSQFEYAQNRIHKALEQSVELEIRSLLNGLTGRFVEPGPSGAPTRGRLDTLPTGRNFFSVDNRSIPSPAAWAIGERSAQALIERHLQEHGDFPPPTGIVGMGHSHYAHRR